MRITLTVLICSLGIGTGGMAQHADHAAPSALVGGHIPREIVERPLPLRKGIGVIRHPTSTKSPEAQAYYEQGLAYLHSYVWIEAARSFNQALRLDPSLALAWVGLSRAFAGLGDAASEASAHARAKELANAVTPREQRWIEVRTKQLDALGATRDAAKRLAYIAALDEALEHDPEDAELWTLRGNVEEVNGGAAGRGQRGGASSIVFYHEAIRRVPGHFAAHHYLIHSYENVGRFDEALKHGAVYAEAAPAVPHALHMYGHDLMKTGQTARAIEIFTRARKLEHDYYAGERILRDYDWHHPHNTALLALSYRHMGQIVETQRLLEDAAEVRMPSEGRLSYHRALVADVLLSRGRYDAALDIAKRLIDGTALQGRHLGHAIAARALIDMGKLDDARDHVKELPGGIDGSGTDSALDYDLARGAFLLRSGQRDAGSKILTSVLTRARRQRTPDGWIEGLFTLETVFHTARAAADWELARTAVTLLLEHDKAYGGSHYAAALLAEQRGDRASASAAFAEAKRLWKDADTDFSPVKDLRSRTQ